MRVLGLDPSLTNFGWCVYDTVTKTVPAHGRFQTSARTLFIDRYMDLRTNLTNLILSDETRPDKIGCEYPIFNDLYSEGLYGLFLFNCEVFRTQKQDVVFFSPGQLKARAREHLDRPMGWKMEKSDMVESAKSLLSTSKGWNHNEADALWAAYLGSRFWEFQMGVISDSDLTEVERKMFTREYTYVRGKKAGKTVKTGILHREDERFFQWSQDNTESNP